MSEQLAWVPDTRLCLNRSGVWEIRWTERAEGRSFSRTHSCGTKDRSIALAYRQAWLLASGRAQAVAGAVTVSELVELYKRDRGVRFGSTQDWSLRHIVAAFGGLAVAAVGSRELIAHRTARLAVVSGPTLRRELGALKSVVAWAEDGGLIPRGVVPKIALPPEGAPQTRYVAEVEEERLWGLASDWFLNSGKPFRERRSALFICLALETAARAGAICGLTWDRVSDGGAAGGVIDYRDPLKAVTRKRRVPVPVSSRLGPVLMRARLDAATGRRMIGPGGGLVLGHAGSVRRGFEGFRDKHGFGDITIHDLRRTWASLRVQWGVPIGQVAAVLGDTVEVTEKHYAHFSPDYLRSAVNARPA